MDDGRVPGVLVLLSEFDIEKGSTLRCYGGGSVTIGAAGGDEGEEAAVAELMLPEGSHHREHDWTFFFLRPMAADPLCLTAKTAGRREEGALETYRELAADSHDGGGVPAAPGWWHCLSVVESRRDKSRVRGANVKALALACEHSWVGSLRPVLVAALDAFYRSEAVPREHSWVESARDLCSKLSLAVKSGLSLPSAPRAIHRLAMRASLPMPGFSPGAPVSGAAAVSLAHAEPRWLVHRAVVEMPSDSEPLERVAVEFPLYLSPGATAAASSMHALVTAFGGATPSALSAVMMGKRVLVVGGKATPSGLVASCVLALASACEEALPGTSSRAIPSVTLTDLSFLESSRGFIAGASNPLFKDRTAWWDVLCDMERSTVTFQADHHLADGSDALTEQLVLHSLGVLLLEAWRESSRESEDLLGIDSSVVVAAAVDEPGAVQDPSPSDEASATTTAATHEEGARAGWRVGEEILASKLKSGLRFGDNWLETVAMAHVEHVVAGLDVVLTQVKRFFGSTLLRSLSASLVRDDLSFSSLVKAIAAVTPKDQLLAAASAFSDMTRSSAQRLSAIAQSPQYWARRLRISDRTARDLELWPGSALLHCSRNGPAPDPLAVLGSQTLASVATLRKAHANMSTVLSNSVLRDCLSALLRCANTSERDLLALSIAFPERSGGLVPIANALLHKTVPIRAFAAAVLVRFEESKLHYVSSRVGSLPASLQRALERQKPLVAAALASRELSAPLSCPAHDLLGIATGASDAAPPPRLAPFNPTSEDGISVALDMLGLTPSDTLLDIGCGDGRVLVEASRRSGCRGVGIELEPDLAGRAVVRAREAGVGGRVTILARDASTVDLASLGATAVFLYLVPDGLALVWPLLLPLVRSGVKAVSYTFQVESSPGVEVETRRVGPVSVFRYSCS
jgi:hypothetical protein